MLSARTLIHHAAMPIALETVRTFAATSGGAYRLELHSDGSLTAEDFHQLQTAAPGIETRPVEPAERMAMLAPLARHPRCDRLLRGAGYMAKLTVLAAASEPFFYFDSDIVWLKPFRPPSTPDGRAVFSTETWTWYFGMRQPRAWIRERVPRRVNSGFALLPPPFPFEQMEKLLAADLYDPTHRYATDQELMAFLHRDTWLFSLEDFARSRVGFHYDIQKLSAVALHFPGGMWKAHLDQIRRFQPEPTLPAREIRLLPATPLDRVEIARMQFALFCEENPLLQRTANALRRVRNRLRRG